ncbi:MAG: FAD-dependent oxidoreductase, partial [Ilumatobacteraceae bacterium]
MALRETHLRQMRGGTFDTLIIGGGINGAVTAASLAGRGASVALIDRGDFAHFTSQASSNLVWGGFKYLENYELYLVWKLCRSRNRLMEAYPDNIKEIAFYAALDATSPYKPWFAGLGAFGYWAIGQFGTKAPRVLSREKIEHEEPSIDATNVLGGIEYHDGILIDNDARFVFSFVRSAIEAGAAAANYVELVSAERSGDRWIAHLRDVDSGGEFTTTASTIVNAAGPFVDELNTQWGLTSSHRIVYSKGIHLVVPRLTTTDHNRVLAFFDDTQRLFYVIPMGRRSVIGTTDTRVDTPFSEVTDDDIEFLLEQINARLVLDRPLDRSDIIAERCGVRPLVVEVGSGDQSEVDWTKLSRKHAVEVDRAKRVVTIFGGKLTDCLNVGEEVAAEIESLGIPLEKDLHNWYGEPARATRDEFYRQARLMRLDDLRSKVDTEPLTDRLWRRYGRRAFAMLDAIR